MGKGKSNFAMVALLIASFAYAAQQPGSSQASAAFQKLRSLAGDWAGTDAAAHPAKSTFKVVAGNTAVMETLSPPGMEEMVTLYSTDKDGIAMIHYCPTNNQPHMRAIPPVGELKELVFEFQGAGNLGSEETGHQHKLVLRFDDENHITESWTWRQSGRDMPMVLHFTRKKI